MGAYYMNGGGNSEIPQVVTGPLANTLRQRRLRLQRRRTRCPCRAILGLSIDPAGTPIILATLHRNHRHHEFNRRSTPETKAVAHGNLNYSDNLAGQIAEAIIRRGALFRG